MIDWARLPDLIARLVMMHVAWLGGVSAVETYIVTPYEFELPVLTEMNLRAWGGIVASGAALVIMIGKPVTELLNVHEIVRLEIKK